MWSTYHSAIVSLLVVSALIASSDGCASCTLRNDKCWTNRIGGGPAYLVCLSGITYESGLPVCGRCINKVIIGLLKFPQGNSTIQSHFLDGYTNLTDITLDLPSLETIEPQDVLLRRDVKFTIKNTALTRLGQLFSQSQARLVELILLNNTKLSQIPADALDSYVNLRRMTISSCPQLRSLPSGLFSRNNQLQEIRVIGNLNLKSLPAGLFSTSVNLLSLRLSWNRLSTLPAGIFDNLANLTNLKIDNNKVLQIFPDVSKLHNLVHLNLLSNNLGPVPAGWLDNNPKLESVFLSSNRRLTIPKNLFSNKPALQSVGFGFTSTNVTTSLLSNNSNIKQIWMHGLGLAALPADFFNAIPNVELLNIAYNKFATVPISITRLGQLKKLNIRGNKLQNNEECYLIQFGPGVTLIADQAVLTRVQHIKSTCPGADYVQCYRSNTTPQIQHFCGCRATTSHTGSACVNSGNFPSCVQQSSDPRYWNCSCSWPGKLSGHQCVSDVDECANPTDNTCGQRTQCVNNVGSYTCVCRTGYKGYGDSCQDVDECANSTDNNCDKTANCVNIDGSYDCSCHAGYKKKGTACLDVDECANSLDNNCDKNAQCRNTDGSYTCPCNAGYINQGASCLDVDECGNSKDNNCHRNANCHNTDGSYGCACKAGYKKEGTSCIVAHGFTQGCQHGEYIYVPSGQSATTTTKFSNAMAKCGRFGALMVDSYNEMCVLNFIKHIEHKVHGYANAPLAGVYIYYPNRPHRDYYRWMDQYGNTYGSSNKDAGIKHGRTVCMRIIDFYCSKSTYLALPPGLNFNDYGPANNTKCRDANMAVPDHNTFGCVQNFVKRVKFTHPSFARPPFAGPMVLFPGDNLRIVDNDGNTRSVYRDFPDLTNTRFRTVCVVRLTGRGRRST